MIHSRSILFAALLVVIVVNHKATTQPPPALPVPNPQAPVLSPLAPLGMQRGTKLELVMAGTNLTDPTGVWTSFPAKVTIPTDLNNGKDATKLRVVLEVPADAPLGFHSVRLATARGISNFRLFCVDDLPQVLEVDTNRTRETAQALTTPCVVVGRADAESSDFYKVNVKAGQRLSFEVLGRRLGSAFDPQMTIYDAKGRDLPGGFSNDAPGLQTDPRLSYTFKEAGDYIVEIRDVMHRGGADYFYRLRIGDFPCATTAFPSAIQRGTKASISFSGPNVEGVTPVEVTAPKEPTATVVWAAPKGASGLHGWPVPVALSDMPEVTEQEPNNEASKATKLTLPTGVSGQFAEKGDIDHYVFAAKKGQRYIIEAQTMEYQSPTEVYLVLKDAKSAQLAASNPEVAPKLDYTATADGDVTLVVEHLHFWGGPEESYHLTVVPFEPGFDLSVGIERFDAAQAGTFAIPIIVNRKDYVGAIDVSVVAGPGITGQVNIPAGPPKPNVPSGTLTITVADNVAVGPQTFFVIGKADINMKPVIRAATFRPVVNQMTTALPVPPPEFDTRFAVAVKSKPPFQLSAKLDAANVNNGGSITATVTVKREASFDGEVAITASGLPANVKAAAAVTIPKGMTEVKVKLDAAANAVAGTYPITFAGKAKVGMAELSGATPPVSLVIVKK